MSSFCGFDMTDLSNGVSLGDKIICPTCLSEFNIEDGKCNFGPAFNNLASYPMINVIELIIKIYTLVFREKVSCFY